MIKVNNEEIKVEHFPDGTQRFNFDTVEESNAGDLVLRSTFHVSWNYENEEELVTLMFLIKHIRDIYDQSIGRRNNLCITLDLPYLPNARFDRKKTRDEVFTLKYFCEIINSLHFDQIRILDVHSNVGAALLDRVVIETPKYYFREVIRAITEDNHTVGLYDPDNLILYFPDEGAAKRYSDLFTLKYITGMKKRDWKTGKILGLDVITNEVDLKDKTILMIDDLVSYGGSMMYSAKKLKELGVGKIYAYATHTENSVLDREKGTLIKALEDGIVEKLYTTDSLYTGKHDKIIVLD